LAKGNQLSPEMVAENWCQFLVYVTCKFGAILFSPGFWCWIKCWNWY